MKDKKEFYQLEKEAKDDILKQVSDNGGLMTKSRLDDLNYKFYEDRFGVKEMKASYGIWVAVSEFLYKEMEMETLLQLGKNTVTLTEEGRLAASLGYTKYLFRKKLDKIFAKIKSLSDFISSMTTNTKWVIAAGTVLISVILYIVEKLL